MKRLRFKQLFFGIVFFLTFLLVGNLKVHAFVDCNFDLGDEDASLYVYTNDEYCSCYDDGTEDSAFEYDKNTKTLTLNNLNALYIELYNFDDITINLIGENNIKTLLAKNSNVTISGNGSLKVFDSSRSIGTSIENGKLIIKDTAKLIIEDKETAISVDGSLQILGGNLEIVGANVAIHYYGGIFEEDNENIFNLENGNITIKDSEYGICSEGKFVVNGGNLNIENTMIGITNHGSAVGKLKIITPTLKINNSSKYAILFDSLEQISIAKNLKFNDNYKPMNVSLEGEIEIATLGLDGLNSNNIDSHLALSLSVFDYYNSEYVIIKKSDKIIDNKNFEIIYDIDFSDFIELRINGKKIEKGKDYSVTEGSTKIVVFNNYLETLDDGKYTIEAVFDSGIVKTDIIVSNITNPSTSDNLDIYIAVFVISVVGMYAGTKLRKCYN